MLTVKIFYIYLSFVSQTGGRAYNCTKPDVKVQHVRIFWRKGLLMCGTLYRALLNFLYKHSSN